MTVHTIHVGIAALLHRIEELAYALSEVKPALTAARQITSTKSAGFPQLESPNNPQNECTM